MRTLRRFDARIKGLARSALAGSSAHVAQRLAGATDWQWCREVLMPSSLGCLPAPLFDDAAVRLAFAEPALMCDGLVARALYARRGAVRRCIDRTVLAQLRLALGDGTPGRERLERLQSMTVADGDTVVPLPTVLTRMRLAHDGLSRLRSEHPMMVPVVVHFVLMQLDEARPAPQRVADARDTGMAGGEAARFFERLPDLIPELS